MMRIRGVGERDDMIHRFSECLIEESRGGSRLSSMLWSTLTTTGCRAASVALAARPASDEGELATFRAGVALVALQPGDSYFVVAKNGGRSTQTTI
jgi:hypothetical protein